MPTAINRHTDETRSIERMLHEKFPSAECYRYNPGAVRIRIVDERFDGKSMLQRERMVMPLIRTLPEETQLDITMLALITENEKPTSLVSVEFDDPSPSRL